MDYKPRKIMSDNKHFPTFDELEKEILLCVTSGQFLAKAYCAESTNPDVEIERLAKLETYGHYWAGRLDVAKRLYNFDRSRDGFLDYIDVFPNVFGAEAQWNRWIKQFKPIKQHGHRSFHY